MTYKEELLERYRLARERMHMGVKAPVVPRPLVNADTAPGGLAGGTGLLMPIRMPEFNENPPDALLSRVEHDARSLGQLNSEVLQQQRDEVVSGYPMLPPLRGYDTKSKFNRWRRLISAVANRHNLKADEILSVSRRRPVIEARFECSYRMRVELGMSFLSIAEKLGRDHSSIIHGVNTIRDRILDAERKRMHSQSVRTPGMVPVVADTPTCQLAAA